MAYQLEKELRALQTRGASREPETGSSLRPRLEALERETFNYSLSRLLFAGDGDATVPLSPETVAQCVGQVLERQLQAEAAAANQNEQSSAATTSVPESPGADVQITEQSSRSATNSGRSALLLQQLEQLVARFKTSSIKS